MGAATRSTGRAARAGGIVLAAGAAAVLLAPARFAAPGSTGGGVRVGPTREDAVSTTSSRPPSPFAASGATAVGAPGGATDGADGVAPTAEGADPAADLRLVELRGGWRDREDLATAVALAVLVGAAHADAVGGTHVAVEAVEQPGPDAAVVTLLVAPRRTAGAEAPRAIRLAVPVRTGAGGVRVAGDPWTLPGPPLDPDPPQGGPVTDPALLESAAAALAGAGFDATGTVSLDATDGWPFVARLDDGAATGSTTVWLRWHLDRFVVAGLPLQPVAGSGQGTPIP